VALAVVAIALVALVKGTAGNAGNLAYMRDKTMSQWVAMNVVAERQLAPIGEVKTDSGTAQMGGQSWYWHYSLHDTFDEGIVRLAVEVSPNRESAEHPVTKVVAFLPRQVTSGGN
jgi:type II secretion system protein I